MNPADGLPNEEGLFSGIMKEAANQRCLGVDQDKLRNAPSLETASVTEPRVAGPRGAKSSSRTAKGILRKGFD